MGLVVLFFIAGPTYPLLGDTSTELFVTVLLMSGFISYKWEKTTDEKLQPTNPPFSFYVPFCRCAPKKSEISILHIDWWMLVTSRCTCHELELLVGDFRCTWILGNDGEPRKFSAQEQQEMVNRVIEPMASGGMRTICIAYKDYVPGID